MVLKLITLSDILYENLGGTVSKSFCLPFAIRLHDGADLRSLVSISLTLSAEVVIEAYAHQFKIEVLFRKIYLRIPLQEVQTISTLSQIKNIARR